MRLFCKDCELGYIECHTMLYVARSWSDPIWNIPLMLVSTHASVQILSSCNHGDWSGQSRSGAVVIKIYVKGSMKIQFGAIALARACA